MTNDYVIINSLLLVFWNSHLETPSTTLIDNVKEVLRNVDTKLNRSPDISTDISVSLLGLLKRLYSRHDPIDRDILKREIIVMSTNDPEIGKSIIENIEQELDQEGIKREVVKLLRENEEHLKRIQFDTTLRKLTRDYLYSSQHFDLSEARSAIVESLNPYQVELSGEGGRYKGIPGVTGYVDLTSDEELLALFGETKREVSPEEILKFPLQGLNRMTGKQNGGRRGETYVIPALSHHGKSITLLMLLRGIAMYNDPIVIKEGAIPTILLVSAENDLTINIRELYGQCYANIYKKPAPDIATIDIDEATAFFKSVMGKRGWHFEMIRVNPSEHTIQAFESIVTGLEANNHEIIVCGVDYLSMFSTKGLNNTIGGQDKQELWRRARNLMTSRKTLFISPHQLSSDAIRLERDRPDRFLEEILNRGYYKDCTSLHQEVDFELNQYKYKKNGVVYIGYGRGKHRGVNDTPEAHKICWYPITECGILDDVEEEESRALSRPEITSFEDDDEGTWGDLFNNSAAVEYD